MLYFEIDSRHVVYVKSVCNDEGVKFFTIAYMTDSPFVTFGVAENHIRRFREILEDAKSIVNPVRIVVLSDGETYSLVHNSAIMTIRSVDYDSLQNGDLRVKDLKPIKVKPL
jgi:hypothetical protein